MKNVLVFTAHPDDHVICGGTLVKLSSAGFTIREVLFTDGERARLVDRVGAKSTIVVNTRLGELARAQKILGISSCTRLHLTNGDVKVSPGTLKKLVALIRRFRPEFVISHQYGDYHPDHVAVSQATMEAVKTANISTMLELGEVFRVPIVLLAEGLLLIDSDVVFDVSREWTKRVEAERVYESQFTARSVQWRENFSGKNGYLLRTKRGEAFEIPNGWPADFSRLVNL